MNWDKGFTAKYYVCVVDPESWEDIDTFDITDGSITRSDTGLRESADLTCKNRRPEGEEYIRVYLDTRQNGGAAHTALFTGIATSPDRMINGNREENPLACYSVLKEAEDVLLERGWFAPKDANGAELVRTLLRSVMHAPVDVDGTSPLLNDYIVAEDKENHLSMTDKILEAIGWRLRIDGRGTVTICPPADEASATFDPNDNDSIEPEVTVKDDWYKCPNVFRAVSSNDSVVIKDESSDSMFSIANRGREVWAEEKDVALSNAESLASYASRRLKELQSRMVNVSYQRRYDPNVLVTDLVQMNYSRQDILGKYRVVSQKITLGYGAQTSEEVERAW